jgi:DNA invertase Pin-like site-specific DNA recombinase
MYSMKIVAYQRVSTSKQGQSGLDLDAQWAAIQTYAAQAQGAVIERFTEVESGKSSSRPELAKALQLAKLTGAVLVIAKLDRLSRDAAFLLILRDSGVRFIAADMPDVNELTVGIMALVAEQERQSISKRTKEALKAAKARGIRLGNPNGVAALKRANKGNAASVRRIQEDALRRAEQLRSVVDDLNSKGVQSLGGLADELNARGVLTARGGRWHRSSVRNLLVKLERA